MATTDNIAIDKLSREDCVFFSKLYFKLERYSTAIKFIKKYIDLNPDLNEEERSLFSYNYTSAISKQRKSLRYAKHLIKKEKKDNHQNYVQILTNFKDKLEKDITSKCDELQNLIDKKIMPVTNDSEKKVFYFKLKADFYRYQCEYLKGQSLEKATKQAEENYNQALIIAEDDSKIPNSIRLGLALNFSVFYYEVKNLKEEAYNFARNILEQSVEAIEEFEKNHEKQSLALIQLIGENISLWEKKSN